MQRFVVSMLDGNHILKACPELLNLTYIPERATTVNASFELIKRFGD